MRWRVARASRCAIIGLVVGVVAAKPNRNETKLIFYDTNALLVVVVVEIHELGEIAEIFARGRLRGAVGGGFDVERDGVSRAGGGQVAGLDGGARDGVSRGGGRGGGLFLGLGFFFQFNLGRVSRARRTDVPVIVEKVDLRRDVNAGTIGEFLQRTFCLLYTSPSPRDS